MSLLLGMWGAFFHILLPLFMFYLHFSCCIWYQALTALARFLQLCNVPPIRDATAEVKLPHNKYKNLAFNRISIHISTFASTVRGRSGRWVQRCKVPSVGLYKTLWKLACNWKISVTEELLKSPTENTDHSASLSGFPWVQNKLYVHQGKR